MSQQITLIELELPGLKLIRRNQLQDQRGFLQRMYCKDMLSQHGIDKPIIQINHTLTREAGTVRGMHFQQAPYAEIKIVTCLRGKVFDVAVDLRAESPTFLQWHGEILSPEFNNSLVIPEGFAHGFQTLSNDCELLYFHTAAYNQQAEGGVCPLDPALAITWPLEVVELSERDKNHPCITANFEGLKNEM
jgi:dTDP-4-dehydrorhamnose 3,5-epimerase